MCVSKLCVCVFENFPSVPVPAAVVVVHQPTRLRSGRRAGPTRQTQRHFYAFGGACVPPSSNAYHPSSATISIIAIGGGTSTNEVRSIGSIRQTWSRSISITDMSFGIISSIGGISIRGIARGSSA